MNIHLMGVTMLHADRHDEANSHLLHLLCNPITGLEWPRGFQEVKVPRFHDNGTGWW